MKSSTLVAIKAILESDKPRNDNERQELMTALGLNIQTTTQGDGQDRLLSIEEAAKQFGRSKRFVHLLARAGHLRKSRFPGSVRCAGVFQSDVEFLIERMKQEV